MELGFVAIDGTSSGGKRWVGRRHGDIEAEVRWSLCQQQQQKDNHHQQQKKQQQPPSSAAPHAAGKTFLSRPRTQHSSLMNGVLRCIPHGYIFFTERLQRPVTHHLKRKINIVSVGRLGGTSHARKLHSLFDYLVIYL